jgi:YopX protein
MKGKKMREIKFRCWNPETKSWATELKWSYKGIEAQAIKAAGSILMQYTGLKDHNGVEIYENDFYINMGDIKARLESKIGRTVKEAMELCPVKEIEWHTTGFNIRPRVKKGSESGDYLLIIGNKFEGIKYPEKIVDTSYPL